MSFIKHKKNKIRRWLVIDQNIILQIQSGEISTDKGKELLEEDVNKQKSDLAKFYTNNRFKNDKDKKNYWKIKQRESRLKILTLNQTPQI